MKAALTDQLGNEWALRLQVNERQKERRNERRNERRDQEVAYLKQSLDRIAAGREEPSAEQIEEVRFSDEDQAAFEEILQEYFS